jgi:hypothetical protein
MTPPRIVEIAIILATLAASCLAGTLCALISP